MRKIILSEATGKFIGIMETFSANRQIYLPNGKIGSLEKGALNERL
jgi:hypothetical protein